MPKVIRLDPDPPPDYRSPVPSGSRDSSQVLEYESRPNEVTCIVCLPSRHYWTGLILGLQSLTLAGSIFLSSVPYSSLCSYFDTGTGLIIAGVILDLALKFIRGYRYGKGGQSDRKANLTVLHGLQSGLLISGLEFLCLGISTHYASNSELRSTRTLLLILTSITGALGGFSLAAWMFISCPCRFVCIKSSDTPSA